MDRRRVRALVLGGAGLVVAGAVGLVLVGPDAGSQIGAGRATASPAAVASFPPLLTTDEIYAAFSEGGSAMSGGETAQLSASPAGELVLPTGRVVAADVHFFSTEPFTLALPAGRHP